MRVSKLRSAVLICTTLVLLSGVTTIVHAGEVEIVHARFRHSGAGTSEPVKDFETLTIAIY